MTQKTMAKILANFTDYHHTEERRKQNTYGALGYYRIVKPASQLKKHQVDVKGKDIAYLGDSPEEQWENIFKQYDIFWVCYFSDPNAASAMFYYAQKHGKKVVLDIDDNFLDVAKSNDVYEKFKDGKKDRAFLSTILSLADAITVSTEPLRDRIKEHIKKIHGIEKPMFIVPNMNDVKDWNFTPVKKHDDKIVIGYSGSTSHEDDLKMVMPHIARLMKKYKNLYFELVGSVPKDKVQRYFGGAGFDDESLQRIVLLPVTPTFKEYPEYLSTMRWDIGIAPLVDTAFTRSKSHIKWLEYSMYGIPVVASRVYPYFMELCGRETITDGETGLLCRPNEWEDKIESLILDGELAERLAKNAYQHIKKNWQYESFDFDAVFDSIEKLPKDVLKESEQKALKKK